MPSSLLKRILFLLVVAASSSAQEAPVQPPQENPQPLHWAVKLGFRSLQVQSAFPLIDRVVLVPDAATYVDELSRWSPQGRWPVLIEDAHFAPMFLRRFQATQIIRRDSVGKWSGSKQERQAQLEQVVIASWGGDATQGSIHDVFTATAYLPPGVVIASVDDPAWTAAVALAAGRGQLLEWFDGNHGKPDALLNPERTTRLRNLVDELVKSLGYPYEEIGDVIDTITICRSMAGRLHNERPPAGPTRIPEQIRDGPIALTDVIGRRADGNRYAYTGWIFGDEIRSAFVAMCSMFLPRRQIELINTYPDEGPWASYAMQATHEKLDGFDYEAHLVQGDEATLTAWRNRLSGGYSCDVLLMNSKGNAADFHLSSGKAFGSDVPLHRVPVAVHLTHSWSMKTPGMLSTIAGRWLDHGAYAYVGSMEEPLLNAFVPPEVIAERLNGLVPFLIAARLWDGEGVFAQPWRINTFGDPLMLCPPPQFSMNRIQLAAEYGVDLEDLVREMMERLKLEPTSDLYAQTAGSLLLLGRDDLVAQIWLLAEQQGKAELAAETLLDVSFRERNSEQFHQAWERAIGKNERHRDMFWHLLDSKLNADVDGRLLSAFESAIRRSLPQVDVRRLAPTHRSGFRS